LFASRSYDDITVAAVARAAGVAKGTVYLYFESKEALFLQLVLEHLGPWFDALAPRLAVVEGPDALGELVASELAARPVLVRLLAIVHTALERNVNVGTALEFKRTVLGWMRAAAARLDACFLVRDPPRDGIVGDGLRAMNRLYALVLGVYQISSDAHPATVARHATAPGWAPELAALEVDFQTELAASVADMMRGLIARKNRPEEVSNG